MLTSLAFTSRITLIERQTKKLQGDSSPTPTATTTTATTPATTTTTTITSAGLSVYIMLRKPSKICMYLLYTANDDGLHQAEEFNVEKKKFT